ncbi:MAG: hypothetical protein ACPL7B_14205 [Candidatus Poribacteria bacterium]
MTQKTVLISRTEFYIKYLITGLLIIHLIPIWSFKFIPTQDGINHVYNAYILKEYNNPNYTKYREVYDLNIRPFPNWTSHAFFFVALYILPPLIAEKVFVTFCVALMPFSFFYFFRSIDKRLWFLGFLGFLYSYNVLLHLGFYNFAISVPLYFFTVGYWWKNRIKMNRKKWIIINLLMMFLYFSHFFSFTWALVSVGLLTITSVILSWDQPKSYKERLGVLIRSAIYFSPSLIVFLICGLINPEDRTKSYKPFKELLEYFLSVKSLVYYNDRYRPISWVLLGLIGFCLLLTIFVLFWHFFRAKKGDHRFYRIFLNQRLGFLLLAIVLTVLYFKIPWAYGPPAWLNDRANLFILPVLAGWFTFSYPKWLKIGVTALIIVLSLAHLGLTIYDYNLLNKDLKELTAGAGLIKDDSTIGIVTDDFYSVPNHGTIKYLSPILHDTCYYCFGNGSHYIGNYEPKYVYFPLQYKFGYWKNKYQGITDYILLWQMNDKNIDVVQIVLENTDIEKFYLKDDYELIFSTEYIKLFKHKSVK